MIMNRKTMTETLIRAIFDKDVKTFERCVSRDGLSVEALKKLKTMSQCDCRVQMIRLCLKWLDGSREVSWVHMYMFTDDPDVDAWFKNQFDWTMYNDSTTVEDMNLLEEHNVPWARNRIIADMSCWEKAIEFDEVTLRECLENLYWIEHRDIDEVDEKIVWKIKKVNPLLFEEKIKPRLTEKMLNSSWRKYAL